MEEIKVKVEFEIKKPVCAYESDLNTVILNLKEVYEIRNRPMDEYERYSYNQTIEKMKRTLEHLKIDEEWC